jgi:3alpha(or 20beta)-hydroxysteroid dehydrogenase
MERLQYKTAIVTGSARGMGEVEARLFVAEGANVLLCDVRDEQGKAVAAELGGAAAYAHLDVSDEAQWAAAVATAQARFGQLDVLVNNAGVALPGSLLGSSMADYHRTVAVNQTGVWLGIRAAAPALRAAGGGSIVNISSAAGLGSSPGLAAYGMTKWAIRGLTKTAAGELAADGVRVNSVHPGLIATEMLADAGIPPESAIVSPLGRFGTAADVAHLVLFLASEESAYCTGGEYSVDGGIFTGVTASDADQSRAATSQTT